MTEHSGWPALIGAMALVKNRVDDLDQEKLQDYTLPRVKASEDQVAAVEAQLGVRLPEEYRNFLLCADGWPALYWNTDLFGTQELFGGGAHAVAEEILDVFEDEGTLADLGLERERALPVGAGKGSPNLFLLITTGPDAGKVSWISSGEEVDRYDDFAEFFTSITEYHKKYIEQLEAERQF